MTAIIIMIKPSTIKHVTFLNNGCGPAMMRKQCSVCRTLTQQGAGVGASSDGLLFVQSVMVEIFLIAVK